MDASSSSTQHQVFINFRGSDIRDTLLDDIVKEMEAAGINVFIDRHQVKGLDLDNLFVEIQKSEVAVVIFSESYTNSEWCLEELVKIKECYNGRTFMAFPVFYNVDTTHVKILEGNFGFHFRALKRMNALDTVKTKKWEDAIKFISTKCGIEKGKKSEKEFINEMIVEVRRSLEHVAKFANDPEEIQKQQPEQIQTRQSEAVQIRQTSDANLQGCVFNVRQLKISSSHNARTWTFESIPESQNTGEAFEIAKMQRCYYLDVCGKFDTRELTMGTRYEVVFVVKVEDTMLKWDNPARVQLMIPYEDLQEREFQFVDLKRNEWIDVQAGVFVARPLKYEIAFYLYQHQSNIRMTGLLVKGALIRSM